MSGLEALQAAIQQVWTDYGEMLPPAEREDVRRCLNEAGADLDGEGEEQILLLPIKLTIPLRDGEELVELTNRVMTNFSVRSFLKAQDLDWPDQQVFKDHCEVITPSGGPILSLPEDTTG